MIFDIGVWQGSSPWHLWTIFNVTVHGEVTSQNLWSQNDRHFVGIDIVCEVKERRFIVLFKYYWINWSKTILLGSLTDQQSLFKRYHSTKRLWRRKPAGIDMEQNDVIVTLYIEFNISVFIAFEFLLVKYPRLSFFLLLRIFIIR